MHKNIGHHLIDIEMHQRFNPPDHPLVVFSMSLLSSLFIILPIFYPVPELWRSQSAYTRFALGSVGILAGPWCLILVLLMLIDHLAHRPTYPSEKVIYRSGYYVYKYFCLGGLTLGIALSGLLAIHRFFQMSLFTLLYGLLLCFQGGYVLLNFKYELRKLYKAYHQINQGGNISLSFLGMLAFSIAMTANNLTNVLNRPITAFLVCVMHVWAAWYFLRLAILNFGRAAIHAGIGQQTTLRR
jgi:hypothetical protein